MKHSNKVNKAQINILESSERFKMYVSVKILVVVTYVQNQE